MPEANAGHRRPRPLDHHTAPAVRQNLPYSSILPVESDERRVSHKRIGLSRFEYPVGATELFAALFALGFEGRIVVMGRMSKNTHETIENIGSKHQPRAYCERLQSDINCESRPYTNTNSRGYCNLQCQVRQGICKLRGLGEDSSCLARATSLRGRSP